MSGAGCARPVNRAKRLPKSSRASLAAASSCAASSPMASSVAAGAARSATIRVGERPDRLALHVPVLELSEAVLQLLQVPDGLRCVAGSCSAAKNSSR